MNEKIEWGLTALGRSGETSIDINESISGPDIYEIEISKANWYLRFRIANTDVAIGLLSFLKNNKSQEFQIGLFSNMGVFINWDIEFSDRLFISISGQLEALSYTISGVNEINELIIALEQVVEDLQ